MTSAAENAADAQPDPGSELESKIFVMRGDRKLVRHLTFSKAAGLRPNSIRVMIGTSVDTALTLKNASFAFQYNRAVEKVAAFYAIPEGDQLRTQMQNTAADFLAYYNLRTQPFKFEQHGNLRAIDDVASPIDAEGKGAPNTASEAPSAPKAPSAMLASGLVRGVTYRSAKGGHPPVIHVRLWRGKGFTLSLENASFAKQYATAVGAVADSLGLAPDDPQRARMQESGQAFLKHYSLTTAAITIPDVVVVQIPDQQS